jgi:D-alanyl-D-alanine carboxypeptidase
MLRSGNDAAVAIAEHLAGDEKTFVGLMNRRARELGTRNTVFQNPHGLHHPEHYTTAYDYSIIAAHAMSISKFREIVGTAHTVISWPGHPWDRHLYNQNKLLEIYAGAEGVKTGWTTLAGRCFVGAANRDGRRLIVVLLKAPEMWEDAIKLLDYGFNSFVCQKLILEGQHLKTLPVLNSQEGRVAVLAKQTYTFPLQEGEDRKVSYRFNIGEPLHAPLEEGERIGELEIYFDEKLIGVVELIAASDVRKRTFWQRLKAIFGRGV